MAADNGHISVGNPIIDMEFSGVVEHREPVRVGCPHLRYADCRSRLVRHECGVLSEDADYGVKVVCVERFEVLLDLSHDRWCLPEAVHLTPRSISDVRRVRPPDWMLPDPIPWGL